jgi:hypothetical protein
MAPSASTPRKGRHSDLVGAGRDALARTRPKDVDTIAIDEGVERFLRLFAAFDPDEVAATARTLYADNAYFNDVFVELWGAKSIADYLAQSADKTAAIEIEVEDCVQVEGEVYLRWTMHFQTSGLRARTVTAPGISHLRFDNDGRIAYHRDYWDGSGALADFVPLVGGLLRTVRSRLHAR